MDFIGRTSELATLNAELERGSGFVVIYGRRRVGKTTLIKEFIKDNKEKFMVGIIPDKFNPNPTEFVIRQGEVEKTFLLTPKFFPAEYNALNNKNVENLIAPDQAYKVVRNYENGDKY